MNWMFVSQSKCVLEPVALTIKSGQLLQEEKGLVLGKTKSNVLVAANRAFRSSGVGGRALVSGTPGNVRPAVALHQILGADGQLAHPLARGGEDRVGHGRGNRMNSGFTSSS